MYTYDVLEPEVVIVIFSALVTTMTQDCLDFILLVVLDIGIDIVTILILDILLKLFKVLNIVNVIRDLGSPTRDADFIKRWPRFLLLLMGTGTIVRARIRRRGLTSWNFEGGCHYNEHEQHGETHTLRLRSGSGRGTLLRFFLFGRFLLGAIFLVSVGAVVLIVNVIIVALDESMGVKNK